MIPIISSFTYRFFEFCICEIDCNCEIDFETNIFIALEILFYTNTFYTNNDHYDRPCAFRFYDLIFFLFLFAINEFRI